MSKRIAPYTLATLVFILFFIMSFWSPLAGDDWGYAYNGLHGNAILLAFQFYHTWSGRFFSELYGFLVTPHKGLWNVLNPSLFTLIYLSILKIVKPKHPWLSGLLLAFWMISVKDELRMETYTWLMGTTYVIPLALSLLVVILSIDNILQKAYLSLFKQIVIGLFIFWIGLTMENISIVMIFWLFLIVTYRFVQNHKLDLPWFSLFLISVISFLILRLSPGAAFRLNRDFPEWSQLSLWAQLLQNYPNFIQHTFLDHKVFVLSFSLMLLFLEMKRKSSWSKAVVMVLLVPALLSTAALSLSHSLNWTFLDFFYESGSLFNQIYWILYSLIVFEYLLTQVKDTQKIIALFFLLGAGLANGSMLLSPVFGYRSSLYTVYFMMIVGLILFNQFNWEKMKPILLLALLLLSLTYGYRLIYKYHLVKQTDLIRQEQIAYYRDNPNEKEAWLIRYPIYTIHSGDIEEWDVYHMDVFKLYYGLKSDVQLIFYYP